MGRTYGARMNGLCRESERRVNWAGQAIELGG